jgi:hypothetical protein
MNDPASPRSQFVSGPLARDFALAGNARITLVSSKTGARFTFRVSAPKARPGQKSSDDVRFVALLNGSDNESAFAFLGTIFTLDRVQIGGGSFGPVYGKIPAKAPKFVHGKKSRIGEGAPSARAFSWAWSYLSRGELPPGCEVWHEGRCGCCGRALTVPESIASGLGPVCASRAPRHEVRAA